MKLVSNNYIMKLVSNNNLFEIICQETEQPSKRNKHKDPKYPMIPILNDIIENENKINNQLCINDPHVYYVYDDWHLVINMNKFTENNEIIPINRQLECIIIEEYNEIMKPIVHKFYRYQNTIYYNNKKIILPHRGWNLKLVLP